ncbi:site-specific integrase [Nocardioides sp. InS609-2]|uniref:tyrosine-type recombinase/integrase n=1 Tax=Nocardioides sp. InS609-2 TaxID=2760705 RepID=UPI0020BDDF18|nr:site-specific integrase [Nocardioides sp. InS609-2]
MAEMWLELLASEGAIENTTISEYRRIVENAILPAIGGILVREARAGRLDKFILSMPTDSRRKKVKVVLGMMFDLAVRHDALPANPVRATSKLRRSPKRVQSLASDELMALRQLVRIWMDKPRPGPKATRDMPDIIDLLLATGARIGEILALRWSDVDLAAARPTVTFCGTIKTETGLGTYRKDSTKTARGMRQLVLPPFAVEMLLRRRVEEPANLYNAVFATRTGTWHQASNVERRWRQIRSGTKFEWVTPHTFRKTVATLIDDAADADTAARVLGHSSSAVTEAHYINRTHVAPDMSDAIQAFAAPFGDGGGQDTAGTD